MRPGSSAVRVPFDPASLAAYRMLSIKAALCVLLGAALGFGYDGRDLNTVLVTLALAVGFAWLLRRIGHSRIATAIEGSALLLAASMATATLSALFATSAFPFRDDLLARADLLLFPGFSWLQMFELLHRQDRLVGAMAWTYGSLLWQPFVLVALLAAFGRERAAWRYVCAWYVALATCVVIFPFAPALGPYIANHIPPTAIPAMDVGLAWRHAEILEPLRDGTLRIVSPGMMTGMIAFPSFHAAGSILLAWGFREVPVIGRAFVVLNLAMFATTPLIGSHYFVDLLGGIAVAALAVAASRKAVPTED
ncbi:hypothetical protein D1610_04270 [Sphingomonas gilva]|uniref:Inositolphosphotransferase Aur1/Ipt1 domain-containing protein n=1 Tax=Sphingomonas gilva TaxID=2305907 RepID=A0A396RTA2_9SPHN|nr:phosphatase PAP2 family protein [Sphingomonas gilva]RHW19326.1 hypothetical protein D1610_04270 [Sphingomonas gilva]